jgi:peptidoglycan/LPS O-acetylase OafA/YrhL
LGSRSTSLRRGGDGQPAHWIGGGHVPCLDGLRAVSICLVLIEHASAEAGLLAHGGLLWLRDIGELGVGMFFGISGFLITLLLVREWNRSNTISMKAFYTRRALRILPVYVSFLLVVYALSLFGALHFKRSDWIGALTYTVNFHASPAWEIGHVWSLSIEEQFYFCWPVFLLFLTPQRAGFAAIGYLLFAPLARMVTWGYLRTDFDTYPYLTMLRLDAIAAGCVLALAANYAEFRAFFKWSNSKAQRYTLAAVGVIAASYVVALWITAFQQTLKPSVEAVGIAIIIWALVNAPTSTIGRMLEARPVVFVGMVSYSLYLWQQLFLNPHPTHWVPAWPIGVSLSFAAAVASYYIIERPFLRLKARVVPKAMQPSATPAESARPAAVMHV